MSHTLELPFQIGDIYWLPGFHPEQVEVPCPVCAGQKRVTLILGSGEELQVACECCSAGFLAPRGVIAEWQHEPRATKFEVAGVRSLHAGRWEVESATGGVCWFSDLCATQADALRVATTQVARQHEENMRRRQRNRREVNRVSWSVNYHRKQIAELERSIAWHRDKIGGLAP